MTDGIVNPASMREGLISQCDLDGAIRKHTGQESYERVARAVLEVSGEITIIEKGR